MSFAEALEREVVPVDLGHRLSGLERVRDVRQRVDRARGAVHARVAMLAERAEGLAAGAPDVALEPRDVARRRRIRRGHQLGEPQRSERGADRLDGAFSRFATTSCTLPPPMSTISEGLSSSWSAALTAR